MATNSFRFYRIARILGCAGLLPFLAALLASAIGVSGLSVTPRWLFVSYSAIILSFLCGSLWGQLLRSDFDARTFSLMLISNLIALLAWTSLLVTDLEIGIVLGMLAAGFLAVLASEYIHGKKITDDTDRDYLRLRWGLTTAVVAMHGLLILYSN